MKNPYKFWMIISLVTVFAAGTLCGILIENIILEKREHNRRERRDNVRFPTLETMALELELTSEQQEQIREIFRQNDERLRSLHKDIRVEFRKLRTQIMDEIRGVLNDTQKEKFQAMIDRYHSERRKQFESRRNGPPKEKKDKGDQK
ncbi:MAG: hypothetical protein JXB26_16020 [Candidatus Aminicenantes bacterium]|nr:hypothetical protein [Candidatus Aminicenantes bacterium]